VAPATAAPIRRSFTGINGAGGAGDGDGPGEYIFVHHTGTAINSSIELEANQRLLGEDVGLSIPRDLNANGSPTNLVPNGPSRPAITSANSTVSIGNAIPIEIRGLALTSTGAGNNAIDLNTTGATTGSASLTIAENDIGGAAAEGIDINANSPTQLSVAITGNTWVTAGTHGGVAIDVNNANTGADTLRVNLSNNTNVLSTGGATTIQVLGGAVNRTTVTGFADNSVHGNSIGTGITVTNVTFDATPGGAIQQVDGNVLAIGAAGNPVGGAGLAITTTQGNLFFDDMDVFAASGTGLQLGGTGTGLTFALTPNVGTIDADNGAAVDVSTVALDLRLQQLDSTTPVAGVNLNTVTGQFASQAGAITKTSGAGTAFTIASSNLTSDYQGSLSVTSGAGVSLTANTGSTMTFRGGVSLSTGANAAFNATGGGTVHVCDESPCNAAATGALVNTLTTTTGTALNVVNTNIGANDLEFRSISSNGAASGIVLNTTGAVGGLVLKGNGGACTSAATCTGGAIQNSTSHGVSLNSTTEPAFTRLAIQTSAGSGVNGTAVSGFSFVNGFIDNSGDAVGESNIAFNGNGSLTGNNISGVLTVTGSTLSDAFDHGIHSENNAGTISFADIQGNTITSSTSAASSIGSGVQLIGTGLAGSVANLTRATISGNTIRNFPSGAGIQVLYGNSNATGPAGSAGTPGHATNVVTITNNIARGQSPANRLNTHAIIVALSGGNIAAPSQGNFVITDNGIVGNPIGDNLGITLGIGSNGHVTVTSTITNNVIVANNSLASGGISGGNGVVIGCAAGSCESPDLTLTTINNNISQTDGNGILLVGRGTTGRAKLGIRSNSVAAPLTGVRPGIRVDAGNASAGSDDEICMDMRQNTTGGSGGHDGIGLRKQGTVTATHDFGVEGMAATATPGVEVYVGNGAGLNPGSTSGSVGGINGVLLLSATSGYSNCSDAP
jgi:hypothetical protein